MRKKLVTAVATVSALALTLTACGNGGGGDNGSAAGGDVTLQMVESLTNPGRTEVIKKLLGEFESANPGVKVNLVSPPSEQADQKIQQSGHVPRI